MTTHTADRNAEAINTVAQAIREHINFSALMEAREENGRISRADVTAFWETYDAVVSPLLAIFLSLKGDRYDGLEMERRNFIMASEMETFLLKCGFPQEIVERHVDWSQPDAIM